MFCPGQRLVSKHFRNLSKFNSPFFFCLFVRRTAGIERWKNLNLNHRRQWGLHFPSISFFSQDNFACMSDHWRISLPYTHWIIFSANYLGIFWWPDSSPLLPANNLVSCLPGCSFANLLVKIIIILLFIITYFLHQYNGPLNKRIWLLVHCVYFVICRHLVSK